MNPIKATDNMLAKHVNYRFSASITPCLKRINALLYENLCYLSISFSHCHFQCAFYDLTEEFDQLN